MSIKIAKMRSKLTAAVIALSVIVIITLRSMTKGQDQTTRINKIGLKLNYFISK